MAVTDSLLIELMREHEGPPHPVAPRPARRRRRPLLLLIAVAAGLAVPTTAIPHGLISSLHFERQHAPFNVFDGRFERHYSGWEALRLRRGAIRMRVEDVTIAASTWHVRATVVNDSPYVVKLHGGRRMWWRGFPLDVIGFGLAFKPVHDVFAGGTPTGRLAHSTASTAAPALPKSMAPGARWSGVFSGDVLLPRGRPILVTFGRFEARGEWPTNPFTHGYSVEPPGKTFFSEHEVVLP